MIGDMLDLELNDFNRIRFSFSTRPLGVSKIMMARRLRNVYRYSRLFMVTRQSVAEHSFNATVIFNEIIKSMVEAALISFDAAYLALNTMLLHDLDESVTGDIPYDFKDTLGIHREDIREACKKMAPGLLKGVKYEGARAADITDLIHYADMAELVLTLCDERCCNSHPDVATVLTRGVTICCEFYDLFPDDIQALEIVQTFHGMILEKAAKAGVR